MNNDFAITLAYTCDVNVVKCKWRNGTYQRVTRRIGIIVFIFLWVSVINLYKIAWKVCLKII